ncbi:MAG: hypothetical protein L0209_12135 [candidate division Zixibacteria bacterium]|nr:hypothetical protein [candidate division Zixibacteria bacterium]
MAAAIDTYDDHRMAMSFALAGLRVEFQHLWHSFYLLFFRLL